MNSSTNNKTTNSANNDNNKKVKQESVVSKSKGKVGEWVRHTSSSGKEYYFNVTSHASQWEKPKEWLDYEKRHGLVPSGTGAPVKSEPKPQQQQQQQPQQSSVSSAAAQQQQQQPQVLTLVPTPEKNHHNNSPYSNSVYYNQNRDQQQRYMDHRFPSSSSSNFNQSVNNVHVHSSTSHHGTPSSSASNFSTSVLRLQQLDGNHQQYNRHSVSSSVSSSDHGSNMSVLNYHGNSNHRLHQDNFRHSTAVRDTRKPSEDMQTEDMDISPLDSNSSPHNSQESNKTTNSRIGASTSNRNDRNTNHSNEGSNCYQRVNNYTRERYRDRDSRDSPRNHRDSNNRSRARDRNNRDVQRERSRSKLRDERSRSPWDNDHTPERRDGDATGNLGSLASLSTLNSGESELPSLSASLAFYYRDDLIEHVKNLPGEAMERQANKVNDDVLTQAAISLSKVSTELKMARSMVRLTDIQSTLKEQRILFLRQQMIKLEQTDHSALMGLGNDE